MKFDSSSQSERKASDQQNVAVNVNPAFDTVKCNFAGVEFDVIRVKNINDTVWVLANPFAKIVGYSNCWKAVSDHVPEENQLSLIEPTSHDGLKSKFVNRSGVVELIRNSRVSKEFCEWFLSSDLIAKIFHTGDEASDVSAVVNTALLDTATSVECDSTNNCFDVITANHVAVTPTTTLDTAASDECDSTTNCFDVITANPVAATPTTTLGTVANVKCDSTTTLGTAANVKCDSTTTMTTSRQMDENFELRNQICELRHQLYLLQVEHDHANIHLAAMKTLLTQKEDENSEVRHQIFELQHQLYSLQLEYNHANTVIQALLTQKGDSRSNGTDVK